MRWAASALENAQPVPCVAVRCDVFSGQPQLFIAAQQEIIRPIEVAAGDHHTEVWVIQAARHLLQLLCGGGHLGTADRAGSLNQKRQLCKVGCDAAYLAEKPGAKQFDT